ncbi:MAG: hypothetical protein H7242_04570 [Microbacteriaceae bacterium]|nr:hypothetical protein [Burkholderiaceae bacterium]
MAAIEGFDLAANGLQRRLQAVEAEVDRHQPLPGLQPALPQVQDELLTWVQALSAALQA